MKTFPESHMSEFSSLLLRIKEIYQSNTHDIHITGAQTESWLFIFLNYIVKNDIFIKKHQIFIFSTEDEAESEFEKFKNSVSNSFYYPGFSQFPFSSALHSEISLTRRINTIQAILNTNEPIYIFTTYQALHIKMPHKDFLTEGNLDLSVSDIIPPGELATKLTQLGYDNNPTIEEPGTFTRKGEIFDIYPISSGPIRVHYFDDMVEEIFGVDRDTLKTNRVETYQTVRISSTYKSIFSNKHILNFRNNLYRPSNQLKTQITLRNQIFDQLNNGILFENYPLYYALFFENNQTLFDYFKVNPVTHFFELPNSQKDLELELEKMNQVLGQERLEANIDRILPEVDQVFSQSFSEKKLQSFNISNLAIQTEFSQDSKNTISLNLDSLPVFLNAYAFENKNQKHEFLKSVMQVLKRHIKRDGVVNFVYKHQASYDEIIFILENENISKEHNVKFIHSNLDDGFFYSLENTLFLTEADLFGKRKQKAVKRKRKNQADLFAEQLSTLQNGDYVIHKQFGLGKYLGIETLNLNNTADDFLVIEYLDNDKVYVPVYKLNLVQKHAEQAINIKVDNLKTQKFDNLKSKARNSVKKLAFDLLELQAKRKMLKGFSFSAPDHLYKEFELTFPFEETPDQINAIEDVLEDMQKETPMDRLICGDVGFGKTEVAMRAAFKAVLDKKQVAILVPTTVLAYQHYNTFLRRFENFPVNIDFISRFKTTKQISEIYSKIELGQVDIVIGTHKLLTDKIKYKDLGLLIIDEEQRFGVAHKEKLKLLKTNIDCLVLTATPIPRTLQMSFLGIKELSLIQTAPLKRQSIKTYIIKQDNYTLKLAIEKELSRGGQVFIVHNRVNDIDEFAAKIKTLTPSAKIVVAHGQLAERELEQKIKDFYEHKFDILVSTTIIESGIDIPLANTMIIDRADTYGLSQLHQLRGRIGRSDRKAYAYFVIPGSQKLSEIATKRLQALQKYADVGSGFNLATSDLEIRGSGDILGAEQSGHIANIGLELYMELLKDAINEIQGRDKHINNEIEIQTPFSTSIPKTYIENQGIRLKYYKRLSNCNDFTQLSEIVSEIVDQYGLPPEAFKNLETILISRIYFRSLGLTSVKVQSTTITLNFNKLELDNDENLRNKVVNFFIQRPKVYQIKPNYSIICTFKERINTNTLVEFAKYIAEQIDPC